MKLKANFLVCLLLWTSAFSLLAATEPFSVTLHAPDGTVKIGSELHLKVKITNTSNREIRFAKGFGNEEYDLDVEVRDAEGKTPPLTTSYREVKEHPGGGSYSTYVLEPGKSFEDDLVLTKLYVITQPGKYTVRVTRGQRPLWQDVKQNTVKSNTITLTITE
ncbi:MAG TPA: hypothetical protein VGR55_08960 [Candidatus Acidoferrum sp.]|nr:hypothetical protein [Candidatus Acidoferrum sp.]